MKILIDTFLILTQAQFSYAQSGEQMKCAKEICEEPNLNKTLKKYCAENSNEKFEESVDDWGPYLNLGASTCWCSCKFDVNHN